MNEVVIAHSLIRQVLNCPNTSSFNILGPITWILKMQLNLRDEHSSFNSLSYYECFLFRVLRQIVLSLPPILDMLILLFFIMTILAMLGW